MSLTTVFMVAVVALLAQIAEQTATRREQQDAGRPRVWQAVRRAVTREPWARRAGRWTGQAWRMFWHGDAA